MSAKAIFYHAGCNVCVEAEQQFITALDANKYDVKSVHLGEEKNLIKEAKEYGVKSVPALVIDGQPFHINYGAGIEALEG